jgi:AcrR family transcriptional regulator
MAADRKPQARARGRAPASRPRDVEATKRRLVDAVGAILARDGFTHLGVNAVAQEARTDKALIYRYFGGFAQLLEAYAESTAFWPTADEMAGGKLEDLASLSLPDRVERVVRAYVQQLRARPLTREILAWELVERNEVTARLEDVRERRGLALMAALVQGLPGAAGAAPPDLPAISSIVAGGIHYLLVRARRIRVFNGIDLRTEEGWARLEAAARSMVLGAIRGA